MKLNYLITIVLFLYSLSSFSQEKPIGVVAFYNLENLFDTEDDPTISDEEFLPEGKNEWTIERYQSKLENMAKVISSMTYGPDIVGLAEVENRKVLEDLVQTGAMAPKKYQIVHFDSPDGRGIDVALIYRSDKFKPFHTKKIVFKDPDNPNFKTRDMLWVKGLYAGDTLNVVVNHWPSRRGGKQEMRVMAAEILRKNIDSVQQINPEAKIILMGDFNDDPTDKSVRKVLRADGKIKKLEKGDLYNPSMKTFKDGFGTLYYKGAWNLFDQIIISKSLLEQNSEKYHYIDNSFKVYAPEWMREADGENRGAPLRTFSYGVFKNGFSDHYPSFIVLGQ
ncbi:endonuclease/exonuclease/phosphatase family protein [Marivirga sp. S37H4]|uniref:Endonuclease/exonuclease/phosphatase family protein n=1 Tax=Marivirga aurantiaca TaxID=2802615 RepID=A0A934WW19_9BACT|nr:endonuclease/exonuclease/phosphatase family protein [Marivirga aurantiaca]MBK6264113.1 endonuclease/exonuclease/phosphatase family protein [Marivirga aurantiaca]